MKWIEKLRLSPVVPVLPFVWNTSISEDEPYDLGEDRLGAHIVGKDQHAALALLKAHYGVRSLPVVPAFEEAMPLWPIEDDNAKSCIEVLTLLGWWKSWAEVRELVRGGQVQLRPDHLGARGFAQPIS